MTERTIPLTVSQLGMLRRQERLVAQVQSVLTTMLGIVVAGQDLPEGEVLRIVDDPPGLVIAVPDPVRSA